jgi:hypothetical protein
LLRDIILPARRICFKVKKDLYFTQKSAHNAFSYKPDIDIIGQNRWFSGLCPLPDILETLKHNAGSTQPREYN